MAISPCLPHASQQFSIARHVLILCLKRISPPCFLTASATFLQRSRPSWADQNLQVRIVWGCDNLSYFLYHVGGLHQQNLMVCSTKKKKKKSTSSLFWVVFSDWANLATLTNRGKGKEKHEHPKMTEGCNFQIHPKIVPAKCFLGNASAFLLGLKEALSAFGWENWM